MYDDNNSSQRIRKAAILIVGMGALGCPATTVLAAAGVGCLTLVDGDRIERSNLQRQTLFADADIGARKVDVAAAALRQRHDGCRIETLAERLDESNADSLIGAHDFVIDATDDPASKLLINTTAVRTTRPACYAGVTRTGGQLMSVVPGVSACLECVFPPVAGTGLEAPGCDRSGILAPVAGVIGSLQALAALQAVSGDPSWRPGVMLLYELRGLRWRFIEFSKDPACATCARSVRQQQARRLEPCHS